MAVLKVAIGIHKYIGASTDTKPTGVPVGSTFFAYNTGIMYICYDGTNWEVFEKHTIA